MRIAALYDIHGNLPAMEAALHACRQEGTSAVVIGGDIAAGPLPAQTLDIVMALGKWAVPIQGPKDRALVEAYDLRMAGKVKQLVAFDPVVAWAAGRITGSHRDFLASLPESVLLHADELGEILFCRSLPGDNVRDVAVDTPQEEIAGMIEGVAARVVVLAGAHAAFERAVGGRRIVSPGSVGMPCGQEPGAAWALFGPEVGLRRTDYDLARAARRIVRSGMPGARALVRERVLSVPLQPGEPDFSRFARQ